MNPYFDHLAFRWYSNGQELSLAEALELDKKCSKDHAKAILLLAHTAWTVVEEILRGDNILENKMVLENLVNSLRYLLNEYKLNGCMELTSTQLWWVEEICDAAQKLPYSLLLARS